MRVRIAALVAVMTFGFSLGLNAQSQGEGFTDERSLPPPIMVKKVVTGPQANTLMRALLDSGVYDTRPLIGAMNLDVSSVVCREPVVLRPIPRCEIAFNNGVLNPNPGVSRVLFDVLKYNRAFTGLARFGVRKVSVSNLKCTKPVYPRAQAHCSYYAAP